MSTKLLINAVLIVASFLLLTSLQTTSWAIVSGIPGSINMYGDTGSTQSKVVTVTGTGTDPIEVSLTQDPYNNVTINGTSGPFPDLAASGGQLTIALDLTGLSVGTSGTVQVKVFQAPFSDFISIYFEVVAPGQSPRNLPLLPESSQEEIDFILNGINGGSISPALQESIDILANSSSSNVNKVTSQLSHESARVSNMQELANLTFNPVFSSVGGRLFALRGGEKGLNMQGLDFLVGQERLSVGKLTNFLTDGGEEIPGIFDKLGIFLNGEIGFGDKDETIREKGFHFNTYEITGGVDYRFTDDIIVGAAIGYVRTEIGIDTSGGNPDADGVTFALYGNYYIKDNFYVDGIVSMGINDFNTSRKIRYTIPDNVNGGTESVNQEMDGDTDALMKSFSIGSGYDFNYKAFTFGPYGRVTYTRIDIEGYKEHASAPGAPGSEWRLHVESQDIDSVTTAFGCQGSYPISTRWAVLTPQARVEWMHEYSSKSRKIHASFVEDSTNTTFFARTDDPDRDFLNWGIGISAVFTNGKTAFVDYERTVGLDDWTSNNITFGFRWEL